VADEEVGEAELVLEIEQEVQDLGLDRLVEGGDRLVQDDELGLERQGAGDVSPAGRWPARELVRVALGEALGIEPDPDQEVVGAGQRLLGLVPWTMGPKAIEASIVSLGFKEE
jgi:hypothetical protein